jgi:hypothetical protein
MADRVRRRDLALAGPKRRSRTPVLLAAVLLVFVLLLLWLALQTLGGHSTKHGAVVPSQVL